MRRLSRQEALCRRVLGQLAYRFLRRHSHNELGFARLSDYTRERLGMSAREIQQMASIAERLEQLPATAATFEEGRLSWTRLRLVVAVASRDTEARWLAEAMQQRCSFLFESAVRQELDARRCSAQGDGRKDPEPQQERRLRLVDNSINGKDRYRFRLLCPRHVRLLWTRTLEFASRMAGSRLAVWQAAEAIGAEGLSGGQDFGALDRLEPGAAEIPIYRVCPKFFTRRRGRYGWLGSVTLCPELEESALREAIPEEVERLVPVAEDSSARELDRRLRRVVKAMQRIDWQTGRLLFSFFDRGLNEDIGYKSAKAYIVEHTSLSLRKARALIAIERKARLVGPVLTESYRDGRLSWVRALTLLPVLGGDHTQAWVERAGEITVRRLADEVEWALVEQDRTGSELPVAPPTPGARLDPWRWKPNDVLPAYSPDSTGPASMGSSTIMIAEASDSPANTSMGPYGAAGPQNLDSPTPSSITSVEPHGVWDREAADSGSAAFRAQTVEDRAVQSGSRAGDLGSRQSRLPDCSPWVQRAVGGNSFPDVASEHEQDQSQSLVSSMLMFESEQEQDQSGVQSGSHDVVRTNMALALAAETVLANSAATAAAARPLPVNAVIVFDAPSSAVTLLKDAILVHRKIGEPMWKSLERMLLHVLEEWENQPRHRDPIFERDGWRCTVPGCSSRRNLQDHHIVFRARGGDNRQTNRVAVCAWHHLRGIHCGRIRATGKAPDKVIWELGVLRGAKPLIKLIGDTYLHSGVAAAGKAARILRGSGNQLDSDVTVVSGHERGEVTKLAGLDLRTPVEAA